MQEPSDPRPGETARKPAGKPRREDRLKAALKANMARRKAQAKARNADAADGQDTGETLGKGQD
jgi:hypothetical protein